MPSSQFEQPNLAASTRTANLLAGDINEFVPYRAQVNVYACVNAAGINITLLADSDVVIDDKEIVQIGTALLKPDHLIESFMVAPKTRISLFLRETAAVATTDALIAVEVNPA